VEHALTKQSLLIYNCNDDGLYKEKTFAESMTNTYQEIFSFSKLSTNDSELIEEKRKHQLKLAWLSLLKAEKAVPKDRLTIVI
jgi:hypothetical protein